MKIYTLEDWRNDQSFNAIAGQEITEAIYEEMYNVLPPLRLPKSAAEHARTSLKIPVSAGFMMGEPHDSVPEGLRYMAFGKSDGRYYFLGLSCRA